MRSTILKLYRHAVLRTPLRTLLVMLAVAVLCFTQSRHFFLDASTDTLLLEHDPQLRLFREINTRYGARSLLVATFTPQGGDVFTPGNLATLGRLRDRLREIPEVETVITLLDVPLFQNPPVPLSQVAENVRTLADDGVDVELAKREILDSEAYRHQLISEDGRTALVAIYLRLNQEMETLRDARDSLQLAIDRGEQLRENGDAFRHLTPELRRLQRSSSRKMHRTILQLRSALDEFRDAAEIHLGGGAMIADDMLSYIRNDLRIFGIAIFVCIAVILKYFFGSKRWVMMAVICCAYSTLVMIGVLGAFEWPVTVISSNFISLLLIMNMSLVIHLVVQYREITRNHPELDAEEAISRTVAHKWTPCLFTTLTTIAGFSSLVLCDIKPVKDFGLMMSLALVISMITSFILFPSLLVLFRKETNKTERDVGRPITRLAAHLTEKAGAWVALGAVCVMVFIVLGMRQLTVENSFVNHFRKSSEIYRGMVFIDRELGGTTPLDVIIDLPAGKSAAPAPADAATDDNEFDEFDEFDETAGAETYWYTPAKLSVVRKAHAIIEEQAETGSVSSLATLLRVVDKLNGNQPLDAFELAIMTEKLPEYARDLLVDPYVSIEHSQFRLTARVYDSHRDLRRDAFLKRLEKALQDGLGLPPEKIRVNGALVLYNGVLQSLFRSQILTLGVVFLVLLAMFVVLFRSLRLALIALFPNLVSALTVLGILGFAGIPLDIMTITIASISIGIAVDDTIHYIHRFREEFAARGNYLEAMRASHHGVGSAMYYTSVTIVVGFSLLVFSNFVPSVLFGLLTSASMVVALFGALTLLPWLLIVLRPLGPERKPTP